MNQEIKLGEADYFILRAKEECEVRENFIYNLSAFLTAARSVLQYTLEEVDLGKNPLAKPGAKAWYDGFMSGNAILKFFKDKRDLNIHVGPVEVRMDVDIMVTHTIFASESVTVKISRPDGSEEIIPSPADSKEEPKGPSSSVESKSTYGFKDWEDYCRSNNIKEYTGNEEVITLCEKYIQELYRLIEEGTRNGFIKS
jgi:hypothetical protein